MKKESDKFLTKNVVYREVLLHRPCLQPTSHLQPASSLPPSAAVVVSAGQPDDLDYTGIYDGMEEEDEGADSTLRHTLPASVPALPSLSHPLPPNVTLALPPTARETEAAAGMESTAAAHEAWVANLVPPPEAPLTPAEIEREAMIARRHQFMESMRNGTLTGDGVAAAREAEIFIS